VSEGSTATKTIIMLRVREEIKYSTRRNMNDYIDDAEYTSK